MALDTFRLCFGNLPEASLLLTTDGLVVDANAAARDLLGGALAGHDLKDLVLDAPERVSRLVQLCRRSRELVPGALAFRGDSPEGTACRVEGALFDLDKTLVLLRAFPKADAARQFHTLTERLETAKQEAVARRRAEAKLAAQQRWFHATLASIGDAVIATDVTGRISFVNIVAEKLTGWTEQEAIGLQLTEVFVISDEVTGVSAENPVDRVLRDGEVVTLPNQTILMAKDGARIPIDDSAAPIRSAEGELSGVVLVFRDVSGQRAAAQTARESMEALRKSEQTYRAIGESILYGVWICEPDGRNIYASESFLRLVGMTQQDCAEFGWGNVLHPDDAEAAIAAWKECARSGDLWNREHRFLGVDGKYHWLLARGVPIRGERGEIVRWAGINLDIDQQKAVEENLRASERELRLANAALVRANEDLSQFAFAASHDLQEPLRMITSFSQFLLQSWDSQRFEDAAMAAHMIGEGTQRMRNLLHDLLEYTQISGDGDHERPDVDLNAVLAIVCDNLRSVIESNDAVVTSDKLPVIQVQEAHFIQLLQNLVENSIKYRSSVAPRIHVSAEPWESGWRITVADNGMGIEPQYHDRIFGVFKRLHGRSIPGTGIGLALCQRVVERYGGRLTVESQLNQGATFRFTLPVSAEQE